MFPHQNPLTLLHKCPVPLSGLTSVPPPDAHMVPIVAISEDLAWARYDIPNDWIQAHLKPNTREITKPADHLGRKYYELGHLARSKAIWDRSEKLGLTDERRDDEIRNGTNSKMLTRMLIDLALQAGVPHKGDATTFVLGYVILEPDLSRYAKHFTPGRALQGWDSYRNGEDVGYGKRFPANNLGL